MERKSKYQQFLDLQIDINARTNDLNEEESGRIITKQCETFVSFIPKIPSNWKQCSREL